MIHELEIVLRPEEAQKQADLTPLVSSVSGISPNRISAIRIVKRSVDARRLPLKIILRIIVVTDEKNDLQAIPSFDMQQVHSSPAVHIAGAGPAGLFAALRLIELGLKPVIFERGSEVHQRKKDIAQLHRTLQINPESNYCFGEGGAGTFSDGKLYTRSNKRGNINRVLELLYLHGAQEEVLYEAHPHIGSDKLPGIIEKIRNSILSAGGEIHFHSKITGIHAGKNKIQSITINNADVIDVQQLILATGHSARDMYRLLNMSGIALEAKGFAMGVRIEHPQSLIDRIQYHGIPRNDFLPTASYSLVQQVNGRGVYSFCMCPGGFIVPAASTPGEQVVNGMSSSGRNSPFANSGFVAEVKEQDLKSWAKYGVLAGLEYQEWFEQMAFYQAGETIQAPAQGLLDFTQKNQSKSLPTCSYLPGIVSSPMHEWMPADMRQCISNALQVFGQRMKGFLTNEGIMTGVESRTSSPVRIPRDKDSFEHTQVKGLFPCGEGAGYAGGIVSSAMDGMNIADKIKEKLK